MFEVIKEEQNVKTVKISLDHEAIEEARGKVYNELSQSVKVKGFRKGKVPKNLLNVVIGMEKINNMIKEDVADMALDVLYENEKFKDFNIMLPPALASVELGEVAEIVFEIHIYPDVEIESLEGEEIEIPEMSDEGLESDMKKELERMREENVILKPKDENEIIETGDQVDIDYHLTGKDEEPRQFEVVVKEPNEGKIFAELVGKKVGDSIEFVDEKDENKTAYTMNVKEVYTRTLADLNDDFAKMIDNEAETLEALKEKLRRKIKGSFDEFVKSFEINNILDRLEKKTKLNISEHSIDLFVNHMIMRQKEDKQYKKSLKDFKGDEKAYKESLKNEITSYLKLKGAVEKIAKEKKIEVSEDEIFGKAKEYYQSLNMSDERLKVTLTKDNELRDRIENEILHNKVAEELLKSVKIITKKIEEEEPQDPKGEEEKEEKSNE